VADFSAGVGALGREGLKDGEPVGGPGWDEYWSATMKIENMCG
jgi:hypothetical protein